MRVRDMPALLHEHRWARGHLSEYLDGELSGSQTKRVEEHVARCPRCRRLLSGLKRTVAALRGLERPAGDDGEIAERVIARLREER